MTPCPKCGSGEMMRPLRVITGGDSFGALKVETHRNPGALLFKGAVSSILQAAVCGGCGYAELYAADPRTLRDAFQEAARLPRSL